MSNSSKKLTKQQKSEILTDWWNSLPKGIQIYARDEVVRECEISIFVWYHWIKGNSEIPETALPVIEQIAQEPLFGITKPEQSKRNFINRILNLKN